MQTDLALVEAEELGLHLECTSAVRPHARVVGRRLGAATAVLWTFGCATTLRDRNIFGGATDLGGAGPLSELGRCRCRLSLERLSSRPLLFFALPALLGFPLSTSCGFSSFALSFCFSDGSGFFFFLT